MLSHKFRRDALELRFHGIEESPRKGVEPQWNATICTPRGVGRLFDSLKLWA